MLDSKSMRSIPWRLWALTLFSSLLQVLPFPIAGPAPLWRRLFCWVCLVPLLLALTGKNSQGKQLRPGQTALLGYTCGTFWYLGNCYWIYQTMYLYGGLPKPVALGILFLFCLYLGLYHALFGWLAGLLRGKFDERSVLLLSPFLWVAVELARGRVTGFPWDLLGYTQVDNLFLTKLAPLGGVLAVGFVVAAVNALASVGFVDGEFRRRWVSGAVALVLALQVGGLFRAKKLESGTVHFATLMQENLEVGAVGKHVVPLTHEQMYEQFTKWSEAPLVRNGASAEWTVSEAKSVPFKSDVVIWPEAPAGFQSDDPEFRAHISALADETQSLVIAGNLGVDLDGTTEKGYRLYDSASLVGKGLSGNVRYDKIHLVPWGEYVPFKSLFSFADKLTAGVGDMDRGTQRKVFRVDQHSYGVFICYESIFGDEVREFVRDGADVLVNISDDGWYGDTGAPWQHLDMERMRAIENRRWILRDTNTGVTTSISPDGQGVFTTPRHVQAAFVFPFDYVSETTFYTRHGDWFAWICAIVTIGFVAVSFKRRTAVD